MSDKIKLFKFEYDKYITCLILMTHFEFVDRSNFLLNDFKFNIIKRNHE